MIVVRFYTKDEYEHVKKAEKKYQYFPNFFEKPEVLDWSMVFYGIYLDSNEPPFRDPESMDFLKEFGIDFVEGDWYSVIYKDKRMPFSGLPEDFKIALAAIASSRQGKYMWFSKQGYDTLKKLSEMSSDILFAVCLESLDSIACITSVNSSCKFVNFPYQGETIEVTCKPYDSFESDAYTKIPYGIEDRECLYKDSNGTYYCDEEVSDLLRYHWWLDIDNIINYIDSCERTKVYLARPSQTYSLTEFGRFLTGNENVLAETSYLYDMAGLRTDYNNGKITKGAYEEGVKNLQNSDKYKQYLYYKNEFNVICHLPFIPEEPSRDLMIMIVDKNADGTYKLFGDKTYYSFKFCDAISSMLYRSANNYMERVGLVIAGEADWRYDSYLASARGLGDALYGFKALKDSIEIFDQYEAIQVFGAALKEAHVSGKCADYSFVRRVIRI